MEDIVEIGIDNKEQLYVKPAKSSFPMIYREAVGVDWDQARKALFGQPNREWGYSKWFTHICTVVNQAGCQLQLTETTKWVNVSSELRTSIIQSHSQLRT
ncbi:MAG: hypothetical protein CL586_09885 [Alteromonadaceae bacterium]|jgi:hypothetical protein|nr:hypothetical protein [Alteromonadaceae bacterium]HCV06048.1 hypothetical protein [Pseudoalteromonas sp.]|tara:strand:+ start:20 stop:319 length:300 start_codon:yes stop_codon:yes gene_type:complete